MRREDLQGWHVGVERCVIQRRQEDGSVKAEDGWALVFQEVAPPTGNQIRFEMDEATKGSLMSMLSGIVIAPGMPTL